MSELNEPRPVRGLAFVLNLCSGAALLSLMLITCIDVFGRYLFNKPLVGGTELIELGLGVVVFTALPVVSWRGEQIAVDILDNWFSPWAHMLRTVLINVLSAGALFFIGQRLMVLGNRALEYGEFSEFLHIPTGWSINFMGIMCWFTALLLLTVGMLQARTQFREATQP